MVPREELPAHLQPQNSIRGKIINYINGIDPRLPKAASKIQIKKVSTGEDGDTDHEEGKQVELQEVINNRGEIIEAIEEYEFELEKQRSMIGDDQGRGMMEIKARGMANDYAPTTNQNLQEEGNE